MIPAPPQISRAEPPANPQNPRHEPRHEAAPLTLPPRLTTAALLAFRRAGGSHDPGWVWRLAAESGAPGQLATAAGRYRGSELTPVTLAPPVPSHTAWMSQPCCPSDVAGTSTPYPRSPTGTVARDRRPQECLGNAEAPGASGAIWARCGATVAPRCCSPARLGRLHSACFGRLHSARLGRRGGVRPRSLSVSYQSVR